MKKNFILTILALLLTVGCGGENSLGTDNNPNLDNNLYPSFDDLYLESDALVGGDFRFVDNDMFIKAGTEGEFKQGAPIKHIVADLTSYLYNTEIVASLHTSYWINDKKITASHPLVATFNPIFDEGTGLITHWDMEFDAPVDMNIKEEIEVATIENKNYFLEYGWYKYRFNIDEVNEELDKADPKFRFVGFGKTLKNTDNSVYVRSEIITVPPEHRLFWALEKNKDSGNYAKASNSFLYIYANSTSKEQKYILTDGNYTSNDPAIIPKEVKLHEGQGYKVWVMPFETTIHTLL